MDEIAYHYQTGFSLETENKYTEWIIKFVASNKSRVGVLNIIFVSDEELLGMNRSYLNHDYYTDIITFDYGDSEILSGDLFVSVDRVRENAKEEHVAFEEEIRRVMIHGVLHLLGYNDKSEEEIRLMRKLENEALSLFHVKHYPNV